MPRFLPCFFVFLIAVPALALNVIFVDNARAGGLGTYDKPFATLAQAQAVSREGDVIYVGEGNTPYAGGITLKRGEMLIGAAYGLDAAAVDFHVQIWPSVPAVQGAGPTIHGTIWLSGDNVVAGCTVAVETGTAIASSAQDASVTLRKVFVRPAKTAIGISLQAPGAVSIQDGGMDGATSATGLMIAGGTADAVIEHFPITGSFGTALGITGRQHGKILFHNNSPLKIDATRDAVVLIDCAAPVIFDDPLQIVTRGGRGMFVKNSNLTVAGGNSSIEAANGAAVDIYDSALDVTFDAISASAADSGIILDKVRGKFAVTGTEEKSGSGGTIRNARSYGVWLTQSSGIRLSHMTIADSGSADAACLDAATNVRCRAAIDLGHVSGSAFDDIVISGGAGVGLNANSITDVKFSGLQISGAGSTPQEPAMFLQESVGAIAFTLCRITSGAGGGAVFDQRFSSARVSFDRCDFGAASSPRPLLSATLRGGSKLELALTGSMLHDTSAPAIRIEARDTSQAWLRFDDSNAQGIGATMLDLSARDSAHAIVSMHRSKIFAGGDRPTLSITAGDAASACIDASENQIATSGAAAQILLAGSPRSTLHVVAASQPVAAAIAQANGGARVVVDARGTVAIVPSCSE